MGQDFVTFLNDTLNSKQIHLRSFQNHRNLWSETLSNLPYQSARYIPDVVQYYHKYFEDKLAAVVDQSSVIISNNTPIGIWPLMIAKKAEGSRNQFMTHGDAVLPPLLSLQYPHRASSRLQHKLFDLMHDYSVARSFTPPNIADVFLGQLGVSEWYAHSIQIVKKSITNHFQYAHLEHGIDFVESNIRKAYKPLINRARKTFTTSIVSSRNANEFSVYKELHHNVSGRVTRSAATWSAQQRLIISGQGFCVLIREEGKPIGAAFFSMSNDEVTYFSAAYKKEYIKQPLGHLALYTAIEYAISQGAKWFRIGLLRQNSAQKITNIDFFKNGFASHIIIENQTDIQ